MHPPPAATAPADRIAILPVLADNYVFVLHDGERAAVVDPAVAGPVIRALEARQLELTAILHTHHHSDHIGGAAGLLRRWPRAMVIAASADLQRIPHQTHGVGEGDRFLLLGRPIEVLEVPGHTRAHLAFHLPGGHGAAGEVFCGDTLFGGGCGRLFEGTPAQMLASLRRLAALPPDTRLWFAHEYTETNLRWALSEAPGDPAISRRLREVQWTRAGGGFTVPSTVGLEWSTNLFLRAGDAQDLARLRESRNHWRG